ncbi:EAL domain-containing protein [Deinococcus taeanensis]|uniref:putative bifunctional diguanylate cyclase/phosphodiesterase n=1 Tax=Deinococcus taeanensis TaxID=2737050 RepID=UPI001CDCAA2B|nr:EAL domain-containing protein [Deinococcus taeanensis]UBV42807.1 EAL domain-containing protein [Deinococcus taeanensis]
MSRVQRVTVLYATLVAAVGLHALWLVTGGRPEALRPILGNLSFFPACLLAALLTGSLAVRESGAVQRAWWFFTAGLGCWAAGQTAYVWLDLSGRSTFPSAADIGYLMLAPCFLLGVLHLWEAPTSRLLTLSFLLDVTIIITAAGNRLWRLSLPDLLDRYAQQPFALGVAVAYPLSDLVLVSLVVAMAVWRPRSLDRAQLALLGGGLSGLLVAHMLYARVAAQGAYELGGPLDLLWPLAFAAFGTAAYLQLTTQAAGTAHRALSTRRRQRLNMLLPAAALILSSTVVLDGARSGRLFEPLTVLILLLLLTRQVLAVMDNGRLTNTLAFQAGHDPLTGLLNRTALHEELDRRIQVALRQSELVGVLFLDLDRMKQINDGYGHAAGDAVLRQVADRLRTAVRGADNVARFGGDEFVLTLTVKDTFQLTQVAQRVLSAVAQPVRFGSSTFHLTASVGVAVCPTDSADAATALHQADVAMYRAKASGKNTFFFYDPQHHAAQLAQGQLEEQLRDALLQDTLELHYQPIVSLKTGQTVSFEALLRWAPPQLGPVSPLTIVTIAEERGLMPELGAWVLRRAVRQLATWRNEPAYASLPHLSVSVNVSASQFEQEQFVNEVRQLLAECHLPGEALVLELTESTFLRDLSASITRMTALRAFGVRIALDDFGTGYSSLSYLRQLPVDHLKIDRSFITPLDDRSQAFIHAMVTLAHAQGTVVIAEGIEDHGQREILKNLHCDLGQGYLFDRPQSATEIQLRTQQAAQLSVSLT